MLLIYNASMWVPPLAVVNDICGWYARDGYYYPESGDLCRLNNMA
jgi:hypothetical protein